MSLVRVFALGYLTNADLGSDCSPNAPAFVVDEGMPHALIIVPVGALHGSAHDPAKEPR